MATNLGLLSVIYFKNVSCTISSTHIEVNPLLNSTFLVIAEKQTPLFLAFIPPTPHQGNKRRPFPMDEKDVSTYHGLAVVLVVVVVIVEHFSQS